MATITHEKPPRLLISIRTSHPTLSLSSEEPFSITLTAKSSVDHTLTIDAFRTILEPRSTALDYQGLAFQDLDTGELAERTVIDILYDVPDRLTATSPSVIEIPPAHLEKAYEVCHTFKRAPKNDPLADFSASALSSMSEYEKKVHRALFNSVDQTGGLLPGHTYTIGLGPEMIPVSWWRKGNRAEVFLRGSLSSDATREALEMELRKTVAFQVVE